MLWKLRWWTALVVVVVVMPSVLARPKEDDEVKLITKPLPGQEYVVFQSGQAVLPSKPETKKTQLNKSNKQGASFATAHKIPGVDAATLSDEEDEEENVGLERHDAPVKRESGNPQESDETILSPEQVLPIRTEYSVVTSKPRKAVPTPPNTPQVNVEPKGDTGVLEGKAEGADERKVMAVKKAAEVVGAVPSIKEQNKKIEELLGSVEVKPGSEAGVTSPRFESREGDITVLPIRKQSLVSSPDLMTISPLTSAPPLAKTGFDVIPVNLLGEKIEPKNYEKDLDFVDSPLADKLLVPAGSSANQQSRIEVKKGPNGQDYEYEYVYYYYDDEDNDTAANSFEKPGNSGESKPLPAAKSTTSTTTTTLSTTTTTTTTTEKPTTSGKRYLPNNGQGGHKESHEEVGFTPPARGRGRNRSSAQGEPNHSEEVAGSNGKGRNRYTTIDRHRGDPTTTVTPEASNEVLPPSRGSRFRGRQLNVQTTPAPVPEELPAEERLPANTRFPPRARSGHSTTTGPSSSSEADSPVTRVRGAGASNSVRRPSLELVDSSSFRTHSSDVSPDQDHTAQSPSYPAVLPAGTTVPDDETANTEQSLRRVPPHIRRTTSTTPLPAADVDAAIEEEDEEEGERNSFRDAMRRGGKPTTEADDTETETTTLLTTTEEDTGLTAAMMDKVALELYAVLQQAHAENASNFVDEDATEMSSEDEDVTTEEMASTTAIPPTTTVTTTTTTTTTTEAPTTTTTTTEAPTTPAPTGRGRYKSRGGAVNHGAGGKNRYRSGGSSTTTTTEAAPVETSSKPRGRFGSNRGTSGTPSFGRRGHPKKPEESHDSEPEVVKEEAKDVSSAPKPGGFSRTRFGAARGSTRVTTSSPTTAPDSEAEKPLTPSKPVFADRFNQRRRGGVPKHTTVAPESAEHSGEETGEPSTVSEAPGVATTAVKPGRARLNIGGGPRPLRPGPRINIGSRGRIGFGPNVTSTTVAPAEAEAENSSEQVAVTDQENQPEAQEAQEAVTTPIPDALTRLRNRPRLRVTERTHKPTTAASPAVLGGSRRNLVSSLLPRRRPLQPETKEPEAAEHQTSDEDSDSSENQGEESQESSVEVTAAPATTAAQEAHDNNRLSSLLSGRRRANAARRPGSLFPSTGRQTNHEAAAT